jgi:hypothetical protein
MYSPYMSEMQRRPAEKGFCLFGLRPKLGHAALLLVHLEPPNFSPRALPGPVWSSNTALQFVLTGPGFSWKT